MIYTLRHPDPKFTGQCAGTHFRNGKGVTKNSVTKDLLIEEHKCQLEATDLNPDEMIDKAFEDSWKKRQEEIAGMIDQYAKLGLDIERKRKVAEESGSTFKEHQEREAKIKKLEEDMAEIRANIRKKVGTGDEEYKNSINSYLQKVNEAAGIKEESPLK